ncbi:hypothetical protein K493DRAFT_297340 [Basidiobolus meristosporus CBS 931.73]|uniref:Endosome-associated-trafficking regulator 1 n=1 Tax=Basidiobolus meristosporus CBS 931.73 TaxID=1314790 RepID=A0A1Y1Z087_9FUNG|nr:hypothetical protein K493DRAFT_297340 [Basidiobolus meristosporus CBS 931.73]|eukprot:ORY03723.1 hypothetical protein K493DRAFT_297340 [Basidiobolus meristosporus CBS 931.73]
MTLHPPIPPPKPIFRDSSEGQPVPPPRPTAPPAPFDREDTNLHECDQEGVEGSQARTSLISAKQGCLPVVPLEGGRRPNEKPGSRRKELPSLPVHEKHVYRELVREGPENGAGLLLEEEGSGSGNMAKVDHMSFVRVQTASSHPNSHDTRSDTHPDTESPPYVNPAVPVNSKPHKYGQLVGQTRSTKPLPKPRTTSGALELAQSELKLAYFQVNSLQQRVSSQQEELDRQRAREEQHARERSELVLRNLEMSETEARLRAEISGMREAMSRLETENARLTREMEKLTVENERRLLAVERQSAYLKAELIKSATFADSAVQQILMGATNVGQVAACLGSLGKIDP